MSGFVLTKTPTGLVVASHGSDEAEAARALRAYDSDLRLVVQGPDEHGPRSWRVYRYMGSERPAQFVCGWWDEYGNPYPQLSVTGLLDMVRRLDRNTRGGEVDPDRENARLVRERKREVEEAFAEVGREFAGRLEGKRSSPLPRGRSLQLARIRFRRRTYGY